MAMMAFTEEEYEVFKKKFSSLSDEFDGTYGVDTEGLDPNNQVNNYGPVRSSVFDEIMRSHGRISEGQIFVDIGSGKGRALLLAALHPFEMITGVEKDSRFCSIAEKNIHRASGKIRGTERIRIDCRDAFLWLEDSWPDGRDIFFFFYCPFDKETFKSRRAPYFTFFNSIRRKARASRARITLAFVNPAEDIEEQLVMTGFNKVAENWAQYDDLTASILGWKLFVFESECTR